MLDGGVFANPLSVEKRWRTYGTLGNLPFFIGVYQPVAPMGQIILVRWIVRMI